MTKLQHKSRLGLQQANLDLVAGFSFYSKLCCLFAERTGYETLRTVTL